MGCDIHVVVERRDHDTNKWTVVEPPEHCNYAYRSRYWFNERQYALFQLLSGVRYGLDDQWSHVMTQGIPDDSDAATYLEDGYVPGLGDHSFGWAPAQRLLDYDWDQQVSVRGDVLTMREHWPLWVEFVESLPNLGDPVDTRVLVGYDS